MNSTVDSIAKLIEEMVPLQFSDKNDNCGLILGDRNKVVNRIMVTLDITDEVIEEAIDNKIDMIISHHPLIYDPMKQINSDTFSGSLILKLLKYSISVYCVHTNLDNAPNGINDVLCKMIGINNVEPLELQAINLYKKIVTFIPFGYEDSVAEAMSLAGAGYIGKYSDCSYTTEGTGTYRPLAGTAPFIGKEEELTKTKESRIEAIISEKDVNSCINAITQTHPYEEIAIDIYNLEIPRIEYGAGRVGDLEKSISFDELVNNVRKLLKCKYVKVVGKPDSEIKRVAIVSGAGSSYFPLALNMKADAFITGEMKYHHAIEAQYYDLNIIEAGHYATERIILPVIINHLQKRINELQYKVEICESIVITDPFISI